MDVPAGEVLVRDEATGHGTRVRVAAFRLAPHPVTGPDGLPRTDLSWLAALEHCNRLSRESGYTPCYRLGEDPDGLDVAWDRAADGYRLPTEAEWEHACRAGTSGDRYGQLDEIAWYRDNSGGRLHPPGEKAPNAWGLHDMLGNVWEWCWDVYDATVYGPYRVFRGGGAFDTPRGCRAACRRRSHPAFHIDDLGFRLARNARAPLSAPLGSVTV
nr:SUMF1/EgtB/PvdO family nonheme iron enzyme [Crossiella equi]